MNNNKKKLAELEKLFSSVNPMVTIPYSIENNIFYAFGNINEDENYSSVIKYIFEDKKPNLVFKDLNELENHYKVLFKDKEFLTIDLKNYISEIENIFKQNE